MKDGDKTTEQWATEVAQLRQRIVELETKEDERKRTEEALRESEEKYRSVIERASDGIAIIQDGILKYANPSLIKMSGYTVAEAINTPFPVYVHSDERSQAVANYKQRIEGDKQMPVGYTSGLLHKDGSRIDVEVSGSTITYHGKPADLVIIRDIRERKQAEEALWESEERFRTIVEQAADAIIAHDLDGQVLIVNSLACKYTGYSKEELLTMNVFDIDHEIIEKEHRRRYWEKLQVDEHAKIESTHIRKDGSTYPAEVHLVKIRLLGQPIVLCLARDITERKRAEEALKESESRFRNIIENSKDGIIFFDGKTQKILFGNGAMAELLGCSKEDLVGRFIPSLHPSVEWASIEQEFQKHVSGELSLSSEVPVLRNDGSVFYADISSSLITLDGRSYFSAFFRDITERKRAEEVLRESEKEIRMIAENVPALFSYIDLFGRYRFINKRYEEWFGIPQKEIIGRHYREVLGEAAYELIKDRVEATLSGQRVYYEEVLPYARGGLRWVSAVYVPDVNDKQEVKGFFALVTDVTERKRMEEALRESEGKYRSLVESSEDSIYLVDGNFNYLFMNTKHLSRLVLKSGQVIGRAYSEFHSPEESKDFTQKVEKVLMTGKSLSYEYRSQRDNRYFIRTLSPVKVSEGGKPIAITVISKDITELKQVEDALREREAFNFALFQYNPAETVVVDLDGRVTGFNLTKKNSGDRLPAIGDVMYKDYAGKHEIDMRAELMKCIKSGKAKEFPERRYADKYLTITIAPFTKGALIISEDITKRKRAEELLQKERDTFFSILHNAPYGVVFLDKDERGIFSNTEFTNITGYTFEEVPTAKDWFRLAYPDKRYRDMVTKIWKEDFVQSEAEKIFRKHFHKAFFQTFKVTCKDGTIKEIEFRPTSLEDGGTIVMIADITERKRMHELLEAAATEWRTTFDAISDTVCLLDLEGRVKRCNNAMVKLIGRPFREIVDRRCWETLYGVSDPPESYPIGRAQKSRHRESDVFLQDKRWFNIAIDPMLNEEGKPIGFVHIMSDITEHMQAEEELQSSREQLRNLTAYLESVREQERTRIAREIHDELAQALTALKMDLSWLGNRLPRDQIPLLEKTQSMSKLIGDTIQAVKRISAELRPGVLDDLGLVAAIEWQIEEFQHRTGIAFHITVDPENITVDQDRSTAIFRIFQETLTNVARHAHATRVSVAIKEKAGKLTLRVSDNGKGIKEKQISDSKSFGILGMRERVHQWGGKISIKGTFEKGTTVLVSVPVARE